MSAVPGPVSSRPAELSYATAAGRWVLLATVLGSSMAAIDATVVGIALPVIGRDFHSSMASLQWVATAYTLTLAGLLLFSGALGDRYGRKKIFLIGVAWFALASVLCGAAPDATILILARAVQGIGAALLSPFIYADLVEQRALVVIGDVAVDGPDSYWVLWHDGAATGFVTWLQTVVTGA